MKGSPRVTRRRMMRIIAFSGAAAAAAASAPTALKTPGVWLNEWLRPSGVVHQSRYLMGVAVNLTLVGAPPEQGAAALHATLQEMARLEQVFSLFDASSALNRLNAQGVLDAPDPALAAVLQQAAQIYNSSSGAFDVSVKPLADVYRAAAAQNGLPSAAQISSALRVVNGARVLCGADQIRLTQPGMALTLDGIAKGAVVDAGVRVLRAHGFDQALLEAGGDLMTSGAPEAAPAWRIALRSPRPQSALVMPRLNLRNRAVATSGDYLQTYTADERVNHILDPRSGHSPTELASATVVAPSAMLADALATTLLVMGREKGLEWIESLPDCAAFLVGKDLQVSMSSQMKQWIQDAQEGG